MAKFGNDVQKAANQANENLTSAVTKVSASLTKPAVAKPSAAKPAPKKLKATVEEFQAKQIAALQKAFIPRESAVAPTTPAVKSGPASKAADVSAPSVSAAAVPGLPDPFGATDPEPYDIPDEVIAIREAVAQRVGPEYASYAREGVEAAYRVSQMVPWLNVIVPAVTILDVLPPAIAGEKDEAQIIVNELIKTSQIGSILYYGYDQVADLANVESDAQAFKAQLYRSTWDLLDPVGLLHVAGTSGLEAL
jgi:hypothetical protein